jgi:sec-independent protein translocase protein TatA
MGGFSFFHLVIILAIVLVIFGPSRLGELGKSMGQAIRGFKKGVSEDPEIDVTDASRRQQLENENESESGSGSSTANKSKQKDRV